MGNTGGDPGFTGTVFERIAQARKTGGGGTITKSYVSSFIISPSASNPVQNRSFTTAFTQDQWDAMKNADILKIAVVKSATQTQLEEGDGFAIFIPRYKFNGVFGASSSARTQIFTIPGGAGNLVALNASRQFLTLQQITDTGSGRGIRGTWSHIRSIESLKETFTIS